MTGVRPLAEGARAFSDFLTSHSIWNCRRLFVTQQTFASFTLLSLHFYGKVHLAMASRGVCLQALRSAEGRVAGSRSASWNMRTFSSQPSNWTSGICQKSAQFPAGARSLPQQPSRIVTYAIPSWLRNRRQFSSSPASRHGHLDPPRPGEE